MRIVRGLGPGPTGMVTVLAAALAGVVGACGGSSGGVAGDVEAAARDVFPDYDIGDAECPEDVTVTLGATFRCTVEIEGQEATIDVTPSGERALRLDPVEALVSVDRVESGLAAELGGQEQVTVECSERKALVREPGDTIVCRADDGQGTTAKVIVTVEDADGNTSYELA